MKPTIKAVAAEAYDYAKYLRTSFDPADITDEEGNISGEIRLRIHDGNWEILTGDPQYDTDHRGAWGYAWVPVPCTKAQALAIARDLINEARDMEAEASE